MKTTLNIRDDLVAEAKARAIKEASTLTKLVEEGLSLRLRIRSVDSGLPLKELPLSKRSGGLRKGIDGRSNRALFDAADE
jgi:hypothetical protein